MLPLTPRERQIADLVCAGADVEEISHEIGIGVWGVKKHVKMIRAKTGARSMSEIPQALARSERVE